MANDNKNSSFRLIDTVNFVKTASVLDRHALLLKYAFISEFSNPLKSCCNPLWKTDKLRYSNNTDETQTPRANRQ